jgi:hypothetical protein
MWKLTAIGVAFLVVSTGVIALARSSTARWERERWERERREVRVRRRPAVAPSAPRSGVPARLGRVLAGVRFAAPIRVLRRAVSRGPATSQRHAAQRMRSARRAWAARRYAVPRQAPSTGVEDPSPDDGPGG